MTQNNYAIPPEFSARANTSAEQYAQAYAHSIESPAASDEFWAKRAENIDWIKKPTKISKIGTNFEDELRKIYKIKSVINTAFGIQIDFYKKPEKDEILNLVDSEVKFKGASIFILFN